MADVFCCIAFDLPKSIKTLGHGLYNCPADQIIKYFIAKHLGGEWRDRDRAKAEAKRTHYPVMSAARTKE